MKYSNDDLYNEFGREHISVFLISLDREKDNRQAVFEELKKLELGPIQVVNAFDGRARLSRDLPRLSPYLGTLGCLISHLQIYLYCYQNGIRRALIFEDDAQVGEQDIAKQAVRVGEDSNVEICCYCSKSSDDRFLNCHAYSMSLLAMQASLSMLDTIAKSPLNIHIDVLIDYCRNLFNLSYRSLPHSSIVQDKSLPFTTKWGSPDFVSKSELTYLKTTLVEKPIEFAQKLNARPGKLQKPVSSGQRTRARRFLISFQGSQGSSAIQDILGKHPDVNIIGSEPFDTCKFTRAKSKILGKPMPAKLLLKCFSHWMNRNYAEVHEIYSKYSSTQLDFDDSKIQGFKYRLIDAAAKDEKLATQLVELLLRNKARLFFLTRKNRLLHAMSRYKGVFLQFKLASGEIDGSEIRQPIEFDLDKLKAVLDRLADLDKVEETVFDFAQSILGRLCSKIFYEDFLYRKRWFLKRMLKQIEAQDDKQAISQMIMSPKRLEKVHSSKIEDIASNHDSIARRFPALFEQYESVNSEYNVA